MHLFLYGPPGSGKSTHGRILAERLGRAFVDLDQVIEANAGQTIPAIFAAEGEAGFRARESRALREAAATPQPCVISLGGGALLNPGNRALAEGGGQIVFLDADARTLEHRCARHPGARPLLDTGETARGDTRPPRGGSKPIAQLLAERAEHYASFKTRVTVSDAPPEDVADALQAAAGRYRVSGMGPPYDVWIGVNLLPQIGRGGGTLGAKTLVVGDSHTAPLYASRMIAGERPREPGGACRAETAAHHHLFTIPAGEAAKTISTVSAIWTALADAGIERTGGVVAVGGGVVGDITGFAAATWMRGIRWINVPTTLLAMVDSGIGGKTGVDHPAGKNLIGAFHPPSLVVADTATLATLPTAEIRCGLAEVIKHAIIGDPGLLGFLPAFACCAATPGHAPCPATQDAPWLATFVARAMAVKIRIIRQDPYEQGSRAALNLGHTVGHALEKLSAFTLPHGHAVAIGTVAEARLAEAAGLAAHGLADELAEQFASVGLPTALPPDTSAARLRQAMLLDKKTADGNIRFALPARLGDVRINQSVDETILQTLDTQRRPV